MSIIKAETIVNGMLAEVSPINYFTINNIELEELYACKLVKQKNEESVWEHTEKVLKLLTTKNTITLLSGLFHDLGKCRIPAISDPYVSKFPGHEISSAEIAQKKLIEWQAEPSIIDGVVRIVSTHMYDISDAKKEKTIRKFIANVGLDNITNWFVLRIADSCSYAAHQRYYNHLIKPFRVAVMSYLSQQPGIGRPKFVDTDETGNIRIEGGNA